MNRPAPHSRRIPYIVAGTALFALLAFLLSQTGYYSFCYLEQWDTFIYNSAYLSGSLALPGGCVQLLSSFLTQFFCRPLTGILITALLLTWIALLTADILHRWTKSKLTLPLALFPVAALFFLHYNVNYQYTGTIAFLWMLLFLRLRFFFHKFTGRFAYSLASTFLLFATAGPVAFLYSCLILIIELFCHKKRALWFISLPLMVYLTAETCLRMGLSGELEHVLLPDGYFTLRLQAGSIIYLPWGLTLAVFITSGLCKSFRFKRRWMQGTLIAAQLACAVAFTFVGIPQYIDRNNEVFKELNHYARHCQWDKITDKCENMPMNNLQLSQRRTGRTRPVGRPTVHATLHRHTDHLRARKQNALPVRTAQRHLFLNGAHRLFTTICLRGQRRHGQFLSTHAATAGPDQPYLRALWHCKEVS